jgi:aarF domain-containing kinase
LIARAYPYIAKRLLTDEAEELRSALEEFLIKDGSFRWTRLEGLVKEGRKVGGIKEEQLWSFLHWLVSEQQAYGVRGALVNDLVPIIEAVGLSATRTVAASLHGILRMTREEAEAFLDQALPIKSAERRALQRALLLQDIGGNAALSSATEPMLEEETPRRGTAPWDAAAEMVTSIQARIEGVRQQVDQTRLQISRTIPEMQRLIESPGLSDILNDIGRGLLTRMGARALKVLLREDQEKEP